MSLRQYLANRWEREKLERIEHERVFYVTAQESALILLKRRPPVLTKAIPALIIAVGWPLGNWCIYQSPVNQGTPIVWVLLWCMIGPAYALPSIIEAWITWRGDKWIFDSVTRRLERNGSLIAEFAQLQHIHVWEKRAKNGTFTRLTIVLKQGKTIVISDYGNWTDLSYVAQRIADHMQLPIKKESLRRQH